MRLAYFREIFLLDVVLMARTRVGQLYDPLNEDNLVMMSSPGKLLPHNLTSKFVKLDLVIFRRRHGLPSSAWLRLPLNRERVDWRILG